MTKLTPELIELVEGYEQYSLEELYNLLGNQIDEYGQEAVQREYVLGLPNAYERGHQFVEDVRSAICKSQDKIQHWVETNPDQVDLISWVGQIADIILSVTITHGIPPWAITVALGKLCNRTFDELCDGYNANTPSS